MTNNKECIWTPIKVDRPRQDMIGYGDASGSNSLAPMFQVEEEEEEVIHIHYGMPNEEEPAKIEEKTNIFQRLIDWVNGLFNY